MYIVIANIISICVFPLQKTDITQHALESLISSKVKAVYMIGRRGPLQAAFTIKELREMLKLQQCQTVWKHEDFVGVAEQVSNLARPRKRITELMLQSLNQQSNETCYKEFRPVFNRSPLEITEQDAVKSVTIGVNKLVGDDVLNKTAILTDTKEVLDCHLLVSSIGYKSVQADKDIPFDHQKGIVKSERCKVDSGVYVAGWLGTGPKGVILSTMSNAFEVAEKIIHDLQQESLLSNEKNGYSDIRQILDVKNVQLVDWESWKRIDKYEQEEGAKLGKPREKIVDLNKMLEIAFL